MMTLWVVLINVYAYSSNIAASVHTSYLLVTVMTQLLCNVSYIMYQHINKIYFGSICHYLNKLDFTILIALHIFRLKIIQLIWTPTHARMRFCIFSYWFHWMQLRYQLFSIAGLPSNYWSRRWWKYCHDSYCPA